MKKVAVALKTTPYNILVGEGLLQTFAEYLPQIKIGATIVVITDSNVNDLYADSVMNSLADHGYSVQKYVIPAGEKYKCQQTVNDVYDWMLSHHFTRDVTVLALGGGVVGDLAGFVAATYLRGVKFIQIPTTLLAQVDSSVGGKVGINHRLGKNVIGAFYQPQIVFIDPTVLSTLPQRELFCGFAEVVKYGFILDADLFSLLARNVDTVIQLQDWEVVTQVISRCCELKSEVVIEDEKEHGLRRILNFGHTFGHALEATTHYSYFNHGEAVAWGMVAACYLSYNRGYLSPEDYEAAISLLDHIEKPDFPNDLHIETILRSIRHDKKMDDRGLNFILLKSIGTSVIERLDETEIRAGIEKILA